MTELAWPKPPTTQTDTKHLCADSCITLGDYVQLGFTAPFICITHNDKECVGAGLVGIICCPLVCFGCIIGMPCTCIGKFCGGKSSAPKMNNFGPGRHFME